MCDLWMPVYDGTILLREASVRNPNTVSILMTGHATKESLIQALNEGHVWKILVGLGWSPQRPTGRARERNEEAIRAWKRRTWPAIKKKRAARAARSSSSTKAG